MHTKLPVVAVVLLLSVGFAAVPSAQRRKLGPETAKSINEAQLDPAFQTTKLDRIAVFPFANTAQFKDAAGILSKNLVAQLSQKQPDYKLVPPDELMNFVNTAKLDDQFNVFLGDYQAAGTAGQNFLETLRSKLQVDAVLVGKIIGYGEITARRGIPGFSRKEYVVGLEMGLYRTTDGRKIWSGKDEIAGKRPEDLQQAAQVIAEVFARFLGRVAY